jgi:hypothetical protein
MRINEILDESQLTELNWKKMAAAGAMGAAALTAHSNPLIDHPKIFGQPGEPQEFSMPVVSSSASKNHDGSLTVSYKGKNYQTVDYDSTQNKLPAGAQTIIIPFAQLGIKSSEKYIGTIVGDKIYIKK